MRIGFMGGTFSPPHKGHLHSAKVFAQEMKLDKLLIIPAKVSPFKVNTVPTAKDSERFEMCKICFECLSTDKCPVEISDIEISKNTTSFTVDTITELKKLYEDAEIFMFVGSDMFLGLERWRKAETIFNSCSIYTRCREQNERDVMLSVKEKYEKEYGATIYFSDDKEIVVSSTAVRDALQTKKLETCQNLLTDEIFRYIIKGGLYFGE